MAQLVARLVRIEKVRGSNPLSSTKKRRSGRFPGLACGPRFRLGPRRVPAAMMAASTPHRAVVLPCLQTGREARSVPGLLGRGRAIWSSAFAMNRAVSSAAASKTWASALTGWPEARSPSSMARSNIAGLLPVRRGFQVRAIWPSPEHGRSVNEQDPLDMGREGRVEKPDQPWRN